MGPISRSSTFTAVALAVWLGWPTGEASAFKCMRDGVQYECTYMTLGKTWRGEYPTQVYQDIAPTTAGVDAWFRIVMPQREIGYYLAWAQSTRFRRVSGEFLPLSDRYAYLREPGNAGLGLYTRTFVVAYWWGETVVWTDDGRPTPGIYNYPVKGWLSGNLLAQRQDKCQLRGLVHSDWNYNNPPPVPEGANNYALCLYQRPPVCVAEFGNPITATGIKVQTEVDWSSIEPLLQLSRHYRSHTVREPNPAAASLVGRFAEGWMFNYQRHLHIDSGVVTAYREQGQNISFDGSVGGDGRRHEDGYALRQVAGGYELSTPQNTVERYDSSGLLRSVWSHDGSSIAISLDGLGRIASVTSHTGRRLVFEYTVTAASGPVGVLSAVLLPDGSRVSYGVDAATGQLQSAGYPDRTSRSYGYTLATPDIPALLNRLTNEASQTSTFTYFNGFATRTTGPGGFGSWGVASARSAAGAGPVTITDPNGKTSTVTFGYQSGRLVVVSNSQPAGSGCAAATSARVVDERGNTKSEDDFNGNRTCRAFLTPRDLESVRVEGLPSTGAGNSCATALADRATLPAGSRKVSTQWHPDWRLPTRRAEAGTITTWVYHGQPDPFDGGRVASCAPPGTQLPDARSPAVVCREVQQATADPSGALGFAAALDNTVPMRQQLRQYNARGQVVAWTDALGNTSRATYQESITADAMPGDLLEQVNALGHTTRYLRYDRHGNWLAMQDANGVGTSRRFDSRQRLTSQTVANATTGIKRNLMGQVVMVNLPDGNVLRNEYDVAQRLTAVVDAAGNRIEYRLDAAGNRIGEDIKDPGGRLRQSLARSFDALGRVEQVTGRE
jgi:YD repeat-containing protein